MARRAAGRRLHSEELRGLCSGAARTWTACGVAHPLLTRKGWGTQDFPDGELVARAPAFTVWNRLRRKRIFASWEYVTNVVVHAYTFSAASR